MGIGNTLRGDDGFGVFLVKSLESGRLPDHLGLFVCEMTPENFVGPLTEFEPDTIVMVDAAELSEPPGSVRLINAQEIAESGMTTHNLSLRLLARMLESATNATVVLLAVQPKIVSFGTELSPEVSQTLRYLTESFQQVFRRET